MSTADGAVAVGREALPEPMPREVQRLVVHLVSGAGHAGTAALAASWGVGANMLVDFATRSVRLDPAALRQLQRQQALPLVITHSRPGPEAELRGLDEVIWDIAMACGRWRLLGAAADSWHRPLVLVDSATPVALMHRLVRLPMPLAIARLIFDGGLRPFTPAQAQSASGLDERSLQGVLQACLFLGVLRWVDERAPALADGPRGAVADAAKALAA